jgi:hypothetical protein
METVDIQIPAPDFSFSDVVKSQALDFGRDHLTHLDIISDGIKGRIEDVYDYLREGVKRYNNKGHKIIFIGELLLFLDKQKGYTGSSNKANYLELISYVQFELYCLASSYGYDFDTNAFSNNEVVDLNSKIDSILEKLNEIQLGQEIIFDDIAELKDDFESLKSDYLLGKKRWYQRATGIVVSYAGTKGADEVYEQLKPLFHDFFSNTVHHFIDKL